MLATCAAVVSPALSESLWAEETGLLWLVLDRILGSKSTEVIGSTILTSSNCSWVVESLNVWLAVNPSLCCVLALLPFSESLSIFSILRVASTAAARELRGGWGIAGAGFGLLVLTALVGLPLGFVTELLASLTGPWRSFLFFCLFDLFNLVSFAGSWAASSSRISPNPSSQSVWPFDNTSPPFWAVDKSFTFFPFRCGTFLFGAVADCFAAKASLLGLIDTRFDFGGSSSQERS